MEIEWQQLPVKQVDINGKYWPIDVSGKAGSIFLKIPDFPESAEGEFTAGLYYGTVSQEGLIASAVRRLASFERCLSFALPGAIEGLLIGIRINQAGQSFGLRPEWQFLPHCCDGESSQGDVVVQIGDYLPSLASLRSVKAEPMKRPTTLLKVGNEYWVFCFSAQALRFDLSWEYLGQIGPAFERPRDSNLSVDRVWDAAIDFQADRVYLSCSSRNLARSYRLSTFTTSPQLLSTIPSDDSKISFAAGCAVLPNGNLAIASRRGIDEDQSGAILEYSPSGELVQILASAPGAGGLIESADYRDWFGKVRWMEGRLWAVSYALRMVVSWELEFSGDQITGASETYRRFVIPSGLPGIAGWTPHGLAIHNGELLVTQNANNGVNPGLYKGVYSLSLNSDSLSWFIGQQKEFGEQAYGDHPALFSNPQDVLPIGFWNGREVFAVVDYGESKIALIPKPEFSENYLPYLTVPVALPEGKSIASSEGIVVDIASQTAQLPLYRLAPVVP